MTTTDRMWLKRLKVSAHPRIEPCELHFSPGMNLVLGRNGTGKTTLLELIGALVRGEVPNAPGGVLDLEWEVELGGETELSVHLTGAVPSAMRRPLAATDNGGGESLRLSASVRSGRGEASLTDRPVQGIYLEELGLWHLIIHQLRDPTEMRILGGALPSLARGAVRVPEDRGAWHWFAGRGDAWPGRSPFQIVVTIDGNGNPLVFRPTLRTRAGLDPGWSTLGRTERDLIIPDRTSAERFLALAGYDHIETVARLQQANAEYTADDGPGGASSYGPLAYTLHRGPVSFSGAYLSFGEQRLLAFLEHLDTGPMVVIADELVNGLHHAWIQGCIEAIGDRQSFLTAQNPLLIDYLDATQPGDVRRSLVLCDRGAGTRWAWRNPTDDEAQDVAAAYAVGMQQLHEVLAARGLW